MSTLDRVVTEADEAHDYNYYGAALIASQKLAESDTSGVTYNPNCLAGGKVVVEVKRNGELQGYWN